MALTADLLRIVDEAHTSTDILAAAVRVIAERLAVEACSAFLLDERGTLTRVAAAGIESLTAFDSEEAQRLAARALAERRTLVHRGVGASILASPMMLRDSLLGAVVLQSVAPHGYSAHEIATLATASAQLVSIVENARIIEALDRGESPSPRAALRTSPAAHGECVLHGVAASPGIAIATALFRGGYRLDLPASAELASDPELEHRRAAAAFTKAHNDVLRIQIEAAREIDEEHALIFASHLLLLNDSTLRAQIDGQIARGVSAAAAIGLAFDELERRLRLVQDAYIQEKVDDVDDLRSRLLDHVLGTARERFGARIVVSARIPPSLVVEIKTEGAQGLVTETGGMTSHGVLLARAMSIPVVTGIAEMLAAVRPDDQLIIDGTKGLVIVRPTAETIARYEVKRVSLERARTEYAKYRDVLGHTGDGMRVTLHANVGVASDLLVARENGAEGVGLYRTEFPFIVRDAFPTRAEQVRIYTRAYEIFPDQPIQFRILDLGGDKFVVGGSMTPARNAFHGYRSIRVLFDHPQILCEQVQALALAAGKRPLRILIPMLSSIDELRQVRSLIDHALATIDEPLAQRQPLVGGMIEVPAAVELALEIAREVDFLSIGTNDLMQYALVVDREDSRMARLSDPYHPAILRMIARVASAARLAGKPLGVCGEIAARPDLALAMLALGVDSLSVVPTALPELKQALAGARLEPMRQAIESIIALPDAASLASALQEAYRSY